MSIMKFIYLAGVLVRNSKIISNYNFLKRSENWPLEKLHEYQLSKLKDLVRHAYSNSKFYKDKYEINNISPENINKLDDLQLLPIITKNELLANASEIQVRNCGERLYLSETSGSTGKPLIFYRNKDWDAWHNASVYRGYSWHGVKPWEKNGYLWGYNIDPRKRLKVRLADFLQNRFRLFSYKDEEIECFLKKLKNARYLGGYSSMLYEIAKKINRDNLSHDFKLKMVKGTSEKILDIYQIEVKKAFGKKIVSEYGSAEGGIIAFECSHGNMHVNMETVIVETIDNEIVLTNLISKSFPIIRYKIGDYIIMHDNCKCECGMTHPVIKEVTGRVGNVVYGKRNKYPSLTLYYVFKNLALNNHIVINYQAVQSTKGSIDLYVEGIIDEVKRDLLLCEFHKYFNNDLDINVKEGMLRDNFSEKRKDFISSVQY